MSKLRTDDLVGVSETLLIPLHHRVTESRSEDGAFKDEAGERFHEAIDYDWNVLHGGLQRLGIVARTQILDREAGAFITANPEALIINLGAGLDTRFYRLDNGILTWIEIDLPDVISFRRKLPERANPRHLLLGGSVLDEDWVTAVKPYARAHILFIAEGLMPYFTEAQHRRIFALLADNFPGQTMLFQTSAPSVLERFAHLSALAKLRTRAEIRWGLEDGADVSTLNHKIRFQAEYSLLDGVEHLLPDEMRRKLSPEAIRGAGKIVRVQFD